MRLTRRKPDDPIAAIDEAITSKQARREQLAAELDATTSRRQELAARQTDQLVAGAPAADVAAVRRELGDVSAHGDALAAAVGRIDEELERLAQERITAVRRQALTQLRSVIDGYLATAAELDQAWDPALRRMAELFERERELDAMAARLGFHWPHVSPRSFAEVLLWRVWLPFELPNGGLISPQDRTTAETYMTRRLSGLLQALEAEVGTR